MEYKKFAEIIKNKRMDLGYTQKDFARIINIGQSKYNKIENGNLEPSFVVLQRIAIELKLDLNELLEIKKPNTDIKIYD